MLFFLPSFNSFEYRIQNNVCNPCGFNLILYSFCHFNFSAIQILRSLAIRTAPAIMSSIRRYAVKMVKHSFQDVMPAAMIGLPTMEPR